MPLTKYIPDQPNIYQGKQVIINSDRLVFNAKEDSILLYSNEAIGFSTNGSFHFDTGILDENKFVVNAPNIYLGLNYEGDLPYSPAVLGYELGDNIYVVILIHAFIFGLLIYLILISFKESDNKNIVNEDKSNEPEDKLEAFNVGGSLTCK